MSQQFIARIAQWMADQIITKRLAQTQAFQRMAQKTHQQVQRGQGAARDLGNIAKEQQDKVLGQGRDKVAGAGSDAKSFFKYFAEEIEKDLAKKGTKK